MNRIMLSDLLRKRFVSDYLYELKTLGYSRDDVLDSATYTVMEALENCYIENEIGDYGPVRNLVEDTLDSVLDEVFCV